MQDSIASVTSACFVPLMLNHERVTTDTAEGTCRLSNKTVATTPSTPMLIWHARETAVAMLQSDESSTAAMHAAVNDCVVRVVPFAKALSGATPLWDACVSSLEQEATSTALRYSLHTPVHSDAAIVNAVTFGLNGPAIDTILDWHPHRAYIANGARFGFGLMSDGAVRRQEGVNPQFIDSEFDQISTWVDKQVASGKLVPLSREEIAHMDGIFVSPFTTAPKAGDVAGAIRTCHHLSAGGKLSVNAGIDFDPLNPIGLLQVDSVVARVQYLMQLHPGRRVFGAKCDMAQYFRQIPLRRRDMARMAQRWKGEVYVHEAFTFGSRSAPHVCSIITNALCDEMARRGHWCQCFIDDCVVIGYEDEIEAAVAALRQLIKEFGLIENDDKFVAPTQDIAIIGVHFDFANFTVGITVEKRAATRALLAAVVSGNETTAGELRSLAGKLQFLSSVVPFARCYTGFLWAAAGDSTKPPHHTVHVNRNMRRAVQWWMEVLDGKRFTVASMALGCTPEHPLIVTSGVTSDACHVGFGAASMTHKYWMQDSWRDGEVCDLATINIRECFGSLCFLAALAEKGTLSGTVVVFETDNECTVWAVNKGHSKKPVLNTLVAAFHVLQERYRFLLVMRHIPGVKNVLSDRLSRMDSPASLGLLTSLGWSELVTPGPLRALLLLAVSNSSKGHVLAWNSESDATHLTYLDDFVLSGMKSMSTTASHLSIPWIPYRDCVAFRAAR